MDPTSRVCPRCGFPAEQHEYCQTCGLHLVEQPELPTRAQWEQRGGTPRSSGSATAASERLTSAIRNAGRRQRIMVLGGVLVFVALSTWIFFGPIDTPIDIGKGNDDEPVERPDASDRQRPATAPVDPETLEVEEAVADRATEIYPGQAITGAACEKTGFTPGGTDIYTCSLATSDGPTVPSDWQILRDPSKTPPIFATPYSGG